MNDARGSGLLELDEFLASLDAGSTAASGPPPDPRPSNPVTPGQVVAALVGSRQLWWNCCQEAIRSAPDWLDSEQVPRVLEFLTDNAHSGEAVSSAAAAVAEISRALVADAGPGPPEGKEEDPGAAGGRDAWRRAQLEKAVEHWRGAGVLPRTATESGLLGDDALAAVAPVLAERIHTIITVLDDMGGGSARAMVAVTALLLAGAQPNRRAVRVPVLFDRPDRADSDPVDTRGVSGTLELHEFPAGPAGLFPDPRTMSLVRADEAFTQAVTNAWTFASHRRRPGRCLLWQLTLDNTPRTTVTGDSLGAPFAIALQELLSYPSPGRPSLTMVRQTFRGLRPNCAVTGAVTKDGHLTRVGGLPTKLHTAHRKHWRLVAPEDNHTDDLPIPDGVHVYWAATIRQANRHARRWRPVRTALAVFVVLILIGSLAVDRSANQQAALAAANQLTTVADQLRGNEPSLAAQFDAAAYNLSATNTAYTNLLNDEDSPLFTATTDTNGPPSSSSQIGSSSTAAFSPDGRTMAISDDDGTIQIHRLTSTSRPTFVGTPLPPPPPSTSLDVFPLAFTPDARTLVAGDRSVIRRWNITDPSHPLALGQPLRGTSDTTSLAVSPDGRVLAAGNQNGTVQLWNLANPAPPGPLGPSLPAITGAPVTTLVFDPTGHTLTTGGGDGSVNKWNVADPAHVTHLGQPVAGTAGLLEPLHPAFGPNGESVVITPQYAEAEVRAETTFLWSLADTSAKVASIPVALDIGSVEATALSLDGLTLAALNSDGSITLWNMADPGDPIPLGPPLPIPQSVNSAWDVSEYDQSAPLVFSPDGHTLAVLYSVGHAALIWHLPPNYRVNAEIDNLNGMAGSAGRVLAVADINGTVSLWKLADPTSVTRAVTADAGGAGALALSADGRTLVITRYGDGLLLWNLADPAHPRLIPVGDPLAHATDFRSSVLSADGRILAVNNNGGAVGLWDITDPIHPRSLGSPVTDVGKAMAFGPKGNVLAIASSDNVRLWNVTGPHGFTPIGPALVGDTGDINLLTFSPDGLTLAADNSDGTANLWNLTDPTHPVLLPTAAMNTTVTAAIAFSPDGHRLATASDDGDVRLWDLTDPAHPAPIGRPLVSSVTTVDRFLIHRRYVVGVQALGFSQDGQILGAANTDGTVRLFELDAKQAIADICAVTQNTLTQHVWQQYAPTLAYRPPCPSAPHTTTAPKTPAPTAVTPARVAPPAATASSQATPCAATKMSIAYGTTTTDDYIDDYTVPLILTNTSSLACTLYGEPMVSLHGPPYSDFGPTFILRSSPTTSPPSLMVAPGGHAHINLTYLSGGSGGEGTDTWVPDSVIVTLPAATGTLTLPWPTGRPVIRQDAASLPGTYTSTFYPGT